MRQGDLAASPGGPLRRHREKRQLEHLAEESEHEESPATARRHVRVIEDQAGTTDQELARNCRRTVDGSPSGRFPRTSGADRSAVRRGVGASANPLVLQAGPDVAIAHPSHPATGTARGRRIPTILLGIHSDPRRGRSSERGTSGSQGGSPPFLGCRSSRTRTTTATTHKGWTRFQPLGGERDGVVIQVKVARTRTPTLDSE